METMKIYDALAEKVRKECSTLEAQRDAELEKVKNSSLDEEEKIKEMYVPKNIKEK